jgi:cysteine-rich repeat protein
MTSKARRPGMIVLALFCFLFLFCNNSFAAVPVCGNGIVEGNEECDNAERNSDPAPNACRTNCVLPSCGDGVADNGEECDDGRSCYGKCNSNKIPNYCREDCRRAHCGDGVVDAGEECDDQNSDPDDGCNNCRWCYPPKDDLVITGAPGTIVRLCPGTYEVKDKGQEGIIIIAGDGVRVDARGVVLKGAPSNAAVAAQQQHQANPAMAPAAGPDKDKKPSLKKKLPDLRGKRKDAAVSGPNTPAEPETAGSPVGNNLPAASQSAVMRSGTGIVIQANDVVLSDAEVEGFRTGVKVKGQRELLFNNRVCNNSTDIRGEQSGNYGVKNRCAVNSNWPENGGSGCSAGCGQ